MKALPSVIALLMALTPVYAQKTKTKVADIGDYPFWNTPKQPNAKPFIPGLNAILMLTKEQHETMSKAKDDALNTDEIREAIKAGKGDAQARAKLDAAQRKVKDAVEGALTPAQKELIEKVSAAYSEARKNAVEGKQAELTSNKGNKEEQAKIMAAVEEAAIKDFTGKLDRLLSKEQKAALEKAAEEIKKRAADSPKKVKPAK